MWSKQFKFKKIKNLTQRKKAIIAAERHHKSGIIDNEEANRILSVTIVVIVEKRNIL